MKRKILIPLLAFVVLVAAFAFSLSGSETRNYKDNYNQKTVNGVVYSLDGNGDYYVKDYFATAELSKNTKEIVLVSEIDGIPVKGIDPEYMLGESYPCVDVITFSEGIEYIGEKAFSSLDGVKKIELPETVRKIGKGAFSEMDSLTQAVLPMGITVIPDDMFMSCPRLMAVTIEGQIESVGAYAFAGCRQLTSFHIPESAKLIGEAAFRGTGLTYLYIPSGVSFTGDGSMNSFFRGCTSLKKVEFENRPDEIFVINEDFFSGCSALEEIILPEAKEIIICKGAFENCKALRKIENSENISCIGSRAFYNCGIEKISLSADIEYKDLKSGNAAVSVFENSKKLKTVIFESGEDVENFILPEKMFKNCDVLSRVMLPATEGEITISDRAFDGCQSLLGVYNTASVSFIGEGAFSDCISMELFVLPEKMTNISEKIFYGCRRLSKVYLHSGIREIGSGAFDKCEKLTDIYYSGSSEEYAEVKKNGDAVKLKNKVRYNSDSYPLLKSLRTELSRGRVRMLWEREEGADGYRVYTIDGIVLKKVADVNGTEYTFRGLVPGQEYSFSVRSYYIRDGERILSPQKEIVIVVAE